MDDKNRQAFEEMKLQLVDAFSEFFKSDAFQKVLEDLLQKRAEMFLKALDEFVREEKNGKMIRVCKSCGMEAHSDGSYAYLCGSNYCRCTC